MLKRFAIPCVFFLALLLFTTFVSLPVGAQQGSRLACQPTPASNSAAGWTVGTNVTVTPTGGSGFELESKDGTAPHARIEWEISGAKLKANPYFTIKILNTGRKDDGAYLRMFFQIGSRESPQIPNPDFKDPNLENWVRANAKSGLHSFHALDALGSSAVTDDAVIIFTLYVDPFGTEEVLKIGELYFSSEKAVAPVFSTAASSAGATSVASSPKSSQVKPSSAISVQPSSAESVTSSSAESISSSEASSTDEEDSSKRVQDTKTDSTPDKRSSVGWIIGLGAAVLVAAGATVGIILFRKNRTMKS